MASIITETETVCDLVSQDNVTELVSVDEITYIDDISDITEIVESINETQILSVESVTEIVDSCVQGAKGSKGNDGTAAQQINVSVMVGASVIADNLSVAINPSSKWIITAIDTVGNKRRISEVVAIHNGIVAKHTHYGITGDKVPYVVDVIISGGLFFQLKITNNHTEDLDLKVLRLSTVL